MNFNLKMRSLKSDNRGVSLTEVVVVVAILIIMSTSVASAIGFLQRGNVKDAAKKVYSAIASNQTYSKAKSGDWVFTCDKSTGRYVLSSTCTTDTGVDNYEEVFLSDRVGIIMVRDSMGAFADELSSIAFQKNTGAVKSINGIAVAKTGYADIDINISGSVATLRLYYLTGEIEMY